MKKHSARVAPLSACNSPVLTLTKVEGNGPGRRGLAGGPASPYLCPWAASPAVPRSCLLRGWRRPGAAAGAAGCPPGCLLPGRTPRSWRSGSASAPPRPVLSPLALEHPPAPAPARRRKSGGVARLLEAGEG